MIIEDRVYGKEEVKEKVLIDLVNSPEIRRLENVSQLGLPKEYYGDRAGFSRREHSIGTFVLVRKLGANITEQIAALLHDSNHLAFSHVIDWIFGDPIKENHQDDNFFEFLKNSSLPNILEKHGFDYKELSDLEKFSLLERESPGLCADRIDYSLREISTDGKKELASYLFNNLSVKNNQIVFKDKENAENFAKEYMFLQETSWGSSDSRMRYSLLAEALKKGFEKEIISIEDLKKPENEILNYLEKKGGKDIKQNLKLLRKGFELIEDSEGVELKTKFRYIDPEVVFNGSYKKLSDFSKDYKQFIKNEKNNSKYFKKMRAVQK